MSDYIVRAISEFYEWDMSQSRKAFSEFVEVPSTLNREQKINFLYSCLEWDDPKIKTESLIDYFIDEFDKDLDSKCASLLHADPCFAVLAKFNLFEFGKNGNLFEETPNAFVDAFDEIQTNTRSLFRIPFTEYIDTTELIYETYCQGNYLGGYYVYPEDLCYKFIDKLIFKRFQITDSETGKLLEISKEIHQFYPKLLQKAGLLALKLPYFSSLPYGNNDSKKIFRDVLIENTPLLIDSLKNVQHRRAGVRNWLNYVLIIKLTSYLGSQNKAIKKVIKYKGLESELNARRARFFENKKYAKKYNLSVEDILNEYNLHSKVKSDLDKLLRDIKQECQ